MKHCTSPVRSMAIWSLAAICAAIVLQPVVGMTLAPPNQGSANDVVLGLMNGTVLPWIKSESDAAQTALNNSIDAFGLCLSGRAQRRAGLESAVNASKSAHEQCRSNQSALYVTWKTCNDLLVILGGVKNSSCANLVTVTGQPAAEADECHTNGHQSYINWLRDQSTRFQTKATTWHSANSSCANATEAYTSKESECEPLRAAVDAEKSNCDDAQKIYETGFCSLGTEIEALCDPTCYTAASRAYHDSIQGIESGERSRKVTWRVVKRIMCLMSVLEDSGGSEADIEACKNATYSTDRLNLVYQAVPARQPCAEVPLPCSTPFLDAYDPMPIHTEAAACTQCPIVSPSPPPPSPWVVVLKAVGEGNTFGYSSPLWENDELLQESSPINELVNAKYQTFLDIPFYRIRMCVGSPDSNCVEHNFTTEWASAKELFSAGYIRDPSLDRDGILDVFAPTTGSYRDCPMQRPGFNIQCKQDNWARMGFCNNCRTQPCQNSDNNDADAAIGIGLRGQSTSSEMGAGWTQYFASGAGTCSPNSMTYKDVWLSVNWITHTIR